MNTKCLLNACTIRNIYIAADAITNIRHNKKKKLSEHVIWAATTEYLS